jgi:hypothetical protein
VAGGTQDVIVLGYDPATKRWNKDFDAAQPLPVPGSPATADTVGLLDQTNMLSQTVAAPVILKPGSSPQLLVAAYDDSGNHPGFRAALIQMQLGAATATWQSATQNMSKPTIDTSSGGTQTVRFTADYLPDSVPLCCPPRSFTAVVGIRTDGTVGEVQDDRPNLGTWLTPDPANPTRTLVLGVDTGSPASGKLKPGDILIDTQGATAPDNTGSVPIVSSFAVHKAGDEVALSVLRSDSQLTVPVTLTSFLTASPTGYTASQNEGELGVQVNSETFQISQVTSGSPSDTAGLTSGDVLTVVNDRPIRSWDDLLVALWGTPGRAITVSYRDDSGTSRTVQMTPGSDTLALSVAHL